VSALQKKRRVLITGGTGSAGQALVAAFATNGYSVTFQYLRDDTTAKRLERHYGAQPLRLDLEKDIVLRSIDFDVVINNAGINISDAATHQVSLDDWDRTLRVNLTAPWQVVRQCIPFMVKRKWGRIVNISSIYGLRAVEGNCPYTVSKHGLAGLTKTIAREYAAYGITCNEICPGPIDSNMMRTIAKRSSSGSVEDYFKEVCEEIPARRLYEVL
jgi:NAD(P)-dependent dehydrogenase (short-subunit alcohol dehydrogenase family)